MQNLHPKVLCILFTVSLTGCVSVGETAIRANRTLYNEAIHDTSNQQLILNIARAHYYDTPTFLTAVEVDGTNSASASISGGSSMLGLLPSAIGAATGTATLSDAPISKYQTLSGNELIQQVSLPVSPQSISRLETSDWPFTPLVGLTINRFTTDFLDYYRAVFTLEVLNRFGAISFESRDRDDLEIIFHGKGNITPTTQQRNDNLDNALSCDEAKGVGEKELSALWMNFVSMVEPSEKAAVAKTSKGPARVSFGREIVVSKKSSEPAQLKADIPIFTYSAYGALKQAEHDQPIVLLSLEDALRIVDANRSDKRPSDCSNDEFYFIPPKTASGYVDTTLVPKYWTDLVSHVRKRNSSSDDDRAFFRSLGHRMAYILVIESQNEIPDAFVSVQRRGQWYSILDTDVVSKKNFLLLNQILTIQAVPSSTPPTSTSIAKTL